MSTTLINSITCLISSTIGAVISLIVINVYEYIKRKRERKQLVWDILRK